jgi:recombination protein RecT
MNMTDPKELTKAEPSTSERFMNKVVSEFSSGVGDIALTDFQKRLAQNYFIAIDAALKSAEEKRKKKSDKYRDDVPVIWGNVNMEQLARSVVAAARVGLDPAQKNHISMLPFKNNNLQKYDIVFIDGYRGIELKSKKYGLTLPDHVIVELVYSKDKFKSYKKDRNNKYEAYDFEIENDFDRGEIIGGFYYHLYTETPEKNKLVVFTLKDILKRKPQHASVEFWGGEKDKWENGKKVGKETTEGWYDQMCYKTVYRAAYSDTTIDSQKIDDDYMRLKQMEETLAEVRANEEIAENANMETIDIQAEVVEDPEPEPAPQETPTEEVKPAQQQKLNLAPTGTDDPGF